MSHGKSLAKAWKGPHAASFQYCRLRIVDCFRLFVVITIIFARISRFMAEQSTLSRQIY